MLFPVNSNQRVRAALPQADLLEEPEGSEPDASPQPDLATGTAGDPPGGAKLTGDRLGGVRKRLSLGS